MFVVLLCYIIADFIAEKLFTDTEGLNRMLEALKPEEKRSWLQKLLGVIRNLINKIKGVDLSAEQRLKNLEKEYAQLLNETTKNEKSTGEGELSNVKYLISEGVEEKIDKILNGEQFRETIKLTENSPSVVYTQKNAKNYPLTMNPTHIRENILTESEARQKGFPINEKTHYHGMGKTLFLNVISDLDKVNHAYRGTKHAENDNRREDYFLLISQHKDKNGDIINVPIYINQKDKVNNVFIDVNKVATVFGRENFYKYIQKELKKGNLVRIKNRSNDVSEWPALIADDYNKIASTNDTLPQTKANVNIKSSIPLKNNTDSQGAMSNRSALADALSTLTQDEAEKRIIEDYKNAVADIDKAQARLDQVNAEIKQILFTIKIKPA